MTAPSNANTSGLEMVAKQIYDCPTRFDGDAIGTHLGLSFMVDQSAQTADDERRIVMSMCEDIALVTAASAQARIAELEADIRFRNERWNAAEARADRLAKGLKDAEESARRYARCYEPSSDGRNTFLMLADHIHALQQETQP